MSVENLLFNLIGGGIVAVVIELTFLIKKYIKRKKYLKIFNIRVDSIILGLEKAVDFEGPDGTVIKIQVQSTIFDSGMRGLNVLIDCNQNILKYEEMIEMKNLVDEILIPVNMSKSRNKVIEGYFESAIKKFKDLKWLK